MRCHDLLHDVEPETQAVAATPDSGAQDKVAPVEPKLQPVPFSTLKRKVNLPFSRVCVR